MALLAALVMTVPLLTAATTSTAAGQDEPVRYTLTVKLLDHTGQIPCDGCGGATTVFNDTWESWMAQHEVQQMGGPPDFAGDGEHSFEVYDGVYTIFTVLRPPQGVGTTDPSAIRVDFLVAMEVPVHGDTEVTLDARDAELLTRPQVGQEVQVRSQTAAWCHNWANGGGVECFPLPDASGTQNGYGAREQYVTPFPDWTLQPTFLWEQWHMGEPQPLSPLPAYKNYGYESFNYSPTPAYMYRTALLHDHGASAQDLTDRTFTAADLVEVPRSYHADKPGTIIGTGDFARPAYPGEPAPRDNNFGAYPANRVYFEPGEVTEYYLADDRFVWVQRDWLHYGPEPGSSLVDFSFFGQEVYLESEAGTRRAVEEHFQAPYQHGAAEANDRYWEHIRTGIFPSDANAQIVPGMVRVGDRFYPPFGHNWDAIPGRAGGIENQRFETSWRMWNADTGLELPAPTTALLNMPTFEGLLPGRATYRLEQTDAYPGFLDPYFLTKPSGTSTTVWTFSSARSDAKLPPDEYRCLLAQGSGNECQIQPLIQLDYDLGLDPYNRAGSGKKHMITIEAAHHLEAVDAAAVKGISVQASFDDGATWEAVRQLGRSNGKGGFRFRVEHPALADTSGFVSLRVKAKDANGGTVDQCITRAYILEGATDLGDYDGPPCRGDDSLLSLPTVPPLP